MKKLVTILSLLAATLLPAQITTSPSGGGGGGSGDALVANPLSQFAATTSSQLKGVISDENAPDGASSKLIMALGSLSIASGKTATFSNSLTLAGTDGTTMTFPTTDATIARTDAANTFTGTQTFGAVVGTTWNGNTWATGTGTLSIAGGKTATVSNTLTLAGTDGTTMTFPSTSATVARTDAANTFTGHQTIEGITSTGATGTGKFVFDNTPTFVTPLLGTPTSGNLANCTAAADGVTGVMTGTDHTTFSTVKGQASGVAPVTANYMPCIGFISGADLKTNATLDIFTVPAGKNFVPTSATAVVTAVTAGAAVSFVYKIIESGASGQMLAASAQGSTTPVIGKVYISQNNTANSGVYCPAAAKVQASITTGFTTSTTVTGTIAVNGYYVP